MRGVYAPVSEIGDAENISKTYVSRILRLALLAPDIADSILAGRTDQLLLPERLEQPLPASWDEQRGELLKMSLPVGPSVWPAPGDRQVRHLFSSH